MLLVEQSGCGMRTCNDRRRDNLVVFIEENQLVKGDAVGGGYFKIFISRAVYGNVLKGVGPLLHTEVCAAAAIAKL